MYTTNWPSTGPLNDINVSYNKILFVELGRRSESVRLDINKLRIIRSRCDGDADRISGVQVCTI